MTEIEKIAALYLLRREELGWSSSDEEELQAWLDQSHRHKAIFWRLEHGWASADRIGALALEPIPVDRRAGRFSALARRSAVALAASLLPILVGATLLFSSTGKPEPEQFATGKGARKIVELTDGTKIELNSETRIQVEMSEKRRFVYLEKGEAFFEVRHDELRPFTVRVTGREITDLGTSFVVRKSGDTLLTAVLEGEVELGRLVEGEVTEKLLLRPGDSALSRGNATLARYGDVDAVQDMLAWRRGLIVFDRVPLSKAAEEFNRYNDRKLLIDPSVGAILIGGSFRQGNMEGFARLMGDAFGLQVRDEGAQIKIFRD